MNLGVRTLFVRVTAVFLSEISVAVTHFSLLPFHSGTYTGQWKLGMGGVKALLDKHVVIHININST
jgi:hypothetical protein